MKSVVIVQGMTVEDLARALQYSGYAVSNTLVPNQFVVQPCRAALPDNVVPFRAPAFLRRQAD